jgi:hypothetical protein
MSFWKSVKELPGNIVDSVKTGLGGDALKLTAKGASGKELHPTDPNYKSKVAAKKQKQREAEGARIAEARAQIRMTGQEVLIAKMYQIKDETSVTVNYGRRGFKTGADAKKRYAERNKHVLPAAQMKPHDILQLIQPADMSAFLHATPAQLSLLQPLLRFFIVSNKKHKKTGRPIQEEVFFSDYASEKKIKDLAAARRAQTLYDPSDNSNTKLFSKGSEVGIKNFTWDYHNKHEGDRIIKAKLELYFGTLTELLNKDYLKFIFTNGREAPTDTDVKDRGDMAARMTKLEKDIETLKKSLKPKTKAPPKSKNDKINDDFKQLKVAVGWSVPKGKADDLLRLFDNNSAKLKSFIDGVRQTQKVILLNLTNYDVNFSQEGPVTLSLDYVGSSDSYFSSVESDILGRNNFSKGNLNSQQVLTYADSLSEALNKKKIDPDGYLYHQMVNDQYGKDLVKETGKIPLRLDRLLRESEFIAKKRELAVLRESYGSNSNSKGQKKALDTLDGYAESVEIAYDKVKKELNSKRYASLINNLIGGTGHGSRIYIAHAKKGFDDRITLSIGKNGAKSAADARKRLEKLAEMSEEERRKFIASETGALGKTFTRGAKDGPASGFQQEMQIPFVLLGDIVVAAMQNADIRDDVKFIFGTFMPGLLGVPGYEYIVPHNEPIYDIPIALDYLVQFLFDNMIDKDRSEYPFRLFFDHLLQAVTKILNTQSNYKMRISFDYTLYMTQTEIESKNDPDLMLLTKKDLKDAQNNLFNQIITSTKPVMSYYVLFARQTQTDFTGNRIKDEKNGIFHYTLGADRGIAKNFNFSKQDVPQFQALLIEQINNPVPGALILPQNISLDMFGNTLHKNGDLICIDSRAALGTMANEILTLGGYYRVVRSSNNISSSGYSTTVDAVFQHRMKNKKSNKK